MSGCVSGVGQDEEPFPLMGGSHAGRWDTKPLRIEPHFGKVGQDVFDSMPANQPWDVFQKQVFGFHVPNHVRNGWPEPSFVLRPRLLAGMAPRLAGESGADKAGVPSQRSGVQVFETARENSSAAHGLVFHPRQDNCRSVAIPLTVAHAAVRPVEEFGGKLDSKGEPADAGAQGEFGNIHIVALSCVAPHYQI